MGEDGRSEMERVREGGTAGRRLVTGVRSGWGCASRSMRTKYEYHIYQQFVVDFGPVSVNTDALLVEAPTRCSSFCRLQKRYQNGGTFRAHSDTHKVFKCTLLLLPSMECIRELFSVCFVFFFL